MANEASTWATGHDDRARPRAAGGCTSAADGGVRVRVARVGRRLARALLPLAASLLVLTAHPVAASADSAESAAPPPLPPPPPEYPKEGADKAPAGEGAGPSERKPKGPLEKESPKRALPDYDGRGPRPKTAGDDLLWVPRVLVSPIYFTTEYLIRRPLGALVSAAERSDIPQKIYDFFLFGPDHKAGVIPTIYFDFGFSPSVGLFAFWDDAGVKNNDLSGHFSIWTRDWIAGSIGDRIRFGNKNYFSVKLGAIKRPDRAFFGLGPDTLQRNISRYGETRLEGSYQFDIPLWRASQLLAGGGWRKDNLYEGDYDGEPSPAAQATAGVFALPYGYGRGYNEEFNHALLAFDSRTKGSGTGVRVEAQGEQGSDVRFAPDSGWIRYQGNAGVFYDFDNRGRILSLTGSVLFADPLEKGGNIPFTEQVALGGNTPVLSALATGVGLMPGFYAGRLVDRSAAVVTVQYRWPIWAWLAGTLQVATGNVFGDHLDEFKLSLLRLSGAVGVESTGLSENALHILIGIGSETFDHGGQIDTVRLAFGTSRF